MKIIECAFCDAKITRKNDSEEHIIPNSIGGRKKISGYICKKCNNNSGREWDSELAIQLNPLSLFFAINRERGNPPSQEFQTTTGKKIKLNFDGSMDNIGKNYSESESDNKILINMQAKTKKEIEKRLKGLKRKYPQINLEELKENLQETTSYCPDPILFNLEFGGVKTGRSIVKTAFALAVKFGIKPKSCEHAREYLLNETGSPCFGYYYEKDPITNRPQGIPLHCVYIKGDITHNQLIGYVEFFGTRRMVVCLSSNYKGPNFTDYYAINPMSGQNLSLEISLNLTPKDIQEIYNYDKFPPGAVEEAFNQVLPLGLSLSFDREQKRVVTEAVNYAYANCALSEGEEPTTEQVKKLTALTMEKLTPFLIHNFNQARKHRTNKN